MHEHADLQGVRAKFAAIWPRKLCLAILRGLRAELVEQGLASFNGVGTVWEERTPVDE